jgi:hypothetical protein
MEPTITQNGALFAVQHRPARKNYRQHDYRNGVKPWQFDPTKWLIWTLSKLGLTRNLHRVPADKIESGQAQTRNASC